MLENGQQFEGDLLVGADGIWSRVLPCQALSSFLWNQIYINPLLNDLNQCYLPTTTILVCMKVLLHVLLNFIFSLVFCSYALQCEFEFLKFVLCTGEEELIWTQRSSVLRLYVLYWHSRFCASWYRDCWVCSIHYIPTFHHTALFICHSLPG